MLATSTCLKPWAPQCSSYRMTASFLVMLGQVAFLSSGKGIKGPSFQVPSSSIISSYFPVCLPMPRAPSLRPVRRASDPYPIDLIRPFLRATSSIIDSLMASEGGFDDQPQPNLFGSQDFPIIIVDPEADIPAPPAQPPLLAPVPVTSSSFRFLSPEFHPDSPRGPPHPDSPVFRPASPPFLIGNPGTIDRAPVCFSVIVFHRCLGANPSTCVSS